MSLVLTPPSSHAVVGVPYSSSVGVSGAVGDYFTAPVPPSNPPACVQSNVAYYGVAGSGGNLPCDFDEPNTQGNIGIGWVTADKGFGPSGIADENTNTWKSLQGYFTNVGYSTLFVCPSLKPGANVATVSGLVGGTPPSQAPVLTLLEYSPATLLNAAAGIVLTGIQALQAALNGNGELGFVFGPVLTMQGYFGASGATWYSTLLLFINTTSADATATARTWSVGAVPGYALDSGVRAHYEDTGTLETGAVLDCTIGSPDFSNSIKAAYAPGSPGLGNSSTVAIGLLLTGCIL